MLQTPVMNAHLDGRSLLQAVEKDGRPLSSLRRISQSLRDPSSCRSEASCLERVGLHDRSPGTTGTHSAGRVGIAGEIIRLPGHASRLRRRMLWRDCILLTPARGAPATVYGAYPARVAVTCCGPQLKPQPQLRISTGSPVQPHRPPPRLLARAPPHRPPPGPPPHQPQVARLSSPDPPGCREADGRPGRGHSRVGQSGA